jgi:hypothetical protein
MSRKGLVSFKIRDIYGATPGQHQVIENLGSFLPLCFNRKMDNKPVFTSKSESMPPIRVLRVPLSMQLSD